MIDALRFVQGAIGTKDFVPALKHFYIHGGRITGTDGKMVLCSPIDFALDCCPLAEPFIRAIESCSDVITLDLTPAGRLSVKSGKVRALVPTIPLADYPVSEAEGERQELDPEKPLLEVLRNLFPLIATDASRQWATGILLKGSQAFATNNVVLAGAETGLPGGVLLNIPRYAIREMLRIGEEPTAISWTDYNVTFYYPEGRWLKTQLLTSEWPDVGAMIAHAHEVETAIPQDFFAGLNTLKHFVDEHNTVYLLDGALCTTRKLEEGSSVQLEGITGPGSYNLSMLSLLEGLAQAIDFSSYPRPASFRGKIIAGIIVGTRDAA